MKVKVIFFASLRDAVGTGTETVELAGDSASVAQVREALIAKGEVWAHAFRNLKRIRAAVNQELAGDDAAVKEGDEVAAGDRGLRWPLPTSEWVRRIFRSTKNSPASCARVRRQAA